MRYVALLRGINVGGNTLVRMADLKACAEDAGLASVRTHIASGNLLFESPERSEARLAARLEEALERGLGLPLRVVVLGRGRYRQIVDAVPRVWIGDETKRVYVAFVLPGGDARAIGRELRPKEGVDELVVTPGALLTATRRDALTRTGLKLADRPEYKQLTVRNLNTALKLRELLDA